MDSTLATLRLLRGSEIIGAAAGSSFFLDIPDANIPRPKIPVISDMQLRKRKLNDKAVVKNQVSKTMIIKIIHESVKILDANCHCLDFSISLAQKQLHT